MSISIVLFLIGAFLLIAFNARKITNDFKEKIPITIYLKKEAKKIEIEQLIKKLNIKDYTGSVNYISKEKGAEILIDEIGEDFVEFYGSNPLLNSIDVFLKSEYVTTLVFDEVSNELGKTDFIDEIIYDAPLVSLINENINKIKYWVLGIAVFFLIISILVEILDPPIIQDIGFVISEVILVRASISKSICNPENEGRNLEISTIEACER